MSKDQPKALAELLKYLRDNPIGPGSVVAMEEGCEGAPAGGGAGGQEL
jgi:hypothetical protein